MRNMLENDDEESINLFICICIYSDFKQKGKEIKGCFDVVFLKISVEWRITRPNQTTKLYKMCFQKNIKIYMKNVNIYLLDYFSL